MTTNTAEMNDNVDETGAAIAEMEAKYKKTTDQRLRFLVVDDLLPLLQAMRQEYIEGFAAHQDDIDMIGDAQRVEGLEKFLVDGLDCVSAAGLLIDGLLKSIGAVDEKNDKTEKFPEEFKASYDALREKMIAVVKAANALNEGDEDEVDDGSEEK